MNIKKSLYVGTAGRGKSDALLMGALQYVEVPEYAEIPIINRIVYVSIQIIMIFMLIFPI
ncbi:hypothetical protein CHI08_13285 [Peribacillus simplex]|nr:hypothetical protein CHI08_13285 [Peribacillus simplex]